MQIGYHWIKSWSKTQPSVTLSSAETELVAMSKAAAEILGITSLAKDLGKIKTGQIFADSASALAVVARRGAGKLRHININHLWLQEIEKREKDPVKFEKIDGTDNPADAQTKYLDKQLIEKYLKWSGHRIASGRAKSGLELQRDTTDIALGALSQTAVCSQRQNQGYCLAHGHKGCR